MNKVKTLVFKKQKILILAQFVALIGIATVAPLFGQQAIAGPVINAILFISVMLLGVQNAILIGLIPSLIALSVGLLPSILAPMIPFIMMGNVILIMVFNYFKERSFWMGMVSSSILKFVFLFSSSSIVINLLSSKEIASRIAMTMGWLQLLTALAGGLIAYIILNMRRKERLNNK